MSGAFGLSLEVQNRLLDEQMEILPRRGHPGKPHPDVAAVQGFDKLPRLGGRRATAFLQYRADATDAAKGTEEAFSSLFEGMDSGFHNVWQQMLEDGKGVAVFL